MNRGAVEIDNFRVIFLRKSDYISVKVTFRVRRYCVLALETNNHKGYVTDFKSCALCRSATVKGSEKTDVI